MRKVIKIKINHVLSTRSEQKKGQEQLIATLTSSACCRKIQEWVQCRHPVPHRRGRRVDNQTSCLGETEIDLFLQQGQ